MLHIYSMSAFLYFVPHNGTSRDYRACNRLEDIPAECNLANVLDEAFWTPIRVTGGPGGSFGTLLAVEPAPYSNGRQAQIIYDNDKQQWMSVENEEGKITHWVGWELDNPPRSCDLVRPLVTDGLPLRLKGQPYLIPLAKFGSSDITALPKRFVWKQGGVTKELKDKFTSISVRCKRQWDWRRKKEGLVDLDVVDVVLEDYEAFYLCCDLLNVNYRISGPEVCALELLDSTSINYIVKYALGIPYAEAQLAAQKKGPPSMTLPDSSDT